MPNHQRSLHVGRPTARVEDAHLVNGDARWTANLDASDMLHLAMVRSPVAHARIADVDLSLLRERQGVVEAWSGADLAHLWREPFPISGPRGAHKVDHYPLAVDTVRHVGDAVACVLATDAYAAADAVTDALVDFEPLPAVVDVQTALADEVLVHSAVGTNVAFRVDMEPVGDVDGAFAQADVVIERRYVNNRVVPASLEPRTTLAVPEPTGGLTVYTSTQVPHRIRDNLGALLGLDRSGVRVIAPDVGGAFGAKLDCYPEDALCAALALKTGRPVRYVATRSEEFQATCHARGQVQQVAVAARADGLLLGLRAHIIADLGAYPSRNGMNIPLNARTLLPGCYRWQAYAFTCTGVFTTTPPTGPYRGAGRPEAIFAVERAVDDLAAVLQMDPPTLRRRNFPPPEAFPFTNIAGLVYDSGRYADALAAALDAAGYEAARSEQARAHPSGDHLRLGVGVSSFVDRCGVGPGMAEWGAVRVDEHGMVEVRTGLSPHGQGTVTSLVQLVADSLGASPDAVTVVHSDTAAVPTGTGTFGSRSMPVGASAVFRAAERVADKAREVAAHLLEAAVEDIEIVDAGFQVRGSPEALVSLADIAHAAYGGQLPAGMQPRLEASGPYEPSTFTVPFGAHVALVEVDTDTGRATVRRYVAVDDVGTVVNPLTLDGQLHGGIAQGIAQALYEEAVFDDHGNPLGSTFMDYLVPSAPDLPPYELLRMVTPTDANPLGVKGAAESGTIGAPPAVVNAIVDALRPFGVDDVPMPCTPERVWRAIRDATPRG